MTLIRMYGYVSNGINTHKKTLANASTHKILNSQHSLFQILPNFCMRKKTNWMLKFLYSKCFFFFSWQQFSSCTTEHTTKLNITRRWKKNQMQFYKTQIDLPKWRRVLWCGVLCGFVIGENSIKIIWILTFCFFSLLLLSWDEYFQFQLSVWFWCVWPLHMDKSHNESLCLYLFHLTRKKMWAITSQLI